VRDAGVIIGEAIAKDAREQGNNLRSSLTVADADSKVVFGRIGRAAGAPRNGAGHEAALFHCETRVLLQHPFPVPEPAASKPRSGDDVF
jgi:hypothetical protein